MYNNEEIESNLWCDGDKISSSFASRIADMLARVVARIVADPNQTVAAVSDSLGKPPASLSAGDMSPDIYRKAATLCECSPSMLEEIYRCTGLQQQQATLSIQGKIPSGGMDQFVYTFGPKEPLDRLRAAVEDAVKEVPALRTRLVSLSGCGVYQTTMRSAPYCVEAESLEDHLLFDQSLPIRYGGPLARFGLIEEKGGNRYLVISLHRTIYDDRTLELVIQAIETLYHGGSMPKVQSFGRVTQLLSQTKPADQATQWDSILSLCTKALPLPIMALSLSDTPIPRTRTLQVDISAVTQGPLKAHLLHAAWAVCLMKWTGGRHVCYGISGAALLGAAIGALPVSGPVDVLLPLATDVTDETSAESCERSLRAEQDKLASVMHAAIPDDDIAALHPESANLFDNALLYRSESQETLKPVLGKLLQRLPAIGACSRSIHVPRLVAHCTLGKQTVGLELQAHNDQGSDEDIDLMLHQFKHAILQVCLHPSMPLSKLEELSEYEISMISRWYQTTLAPVHTPVHTRISQAAKTQWPNAPALWSWDGELDYTQLDGLSDRVATFLQRRGVGRGAVIPYFLEKSSAAVIVQLGILKAGGCLLAMEVSHPRNRVLSIIKETNPRCIICSPCYLGQLEYLKDTNMHQFDLESISKLQGGSCLPAEVRGEDPCYIIYTSGSSGTPKGVVMTHASLAAGVTYQSTSIGLSPTSRCLQFSSFVFDVSMIDTFETLVLGACLCLPSEAERINDLHGVIRRSRCDYMCITPSLAQALEPSELPGLRVLALAGEAVPKGMVHKWQHIRLLNLYGPSENAMITSSSDISSGSGKSRLSIGAGLGCRFWVVDPTCHDRLVSPGSQGELLIQGPAVARGYLNRPELTKAAFIEPPAWARRFKSLNMSHGWYKTGDIVIQRADGTALYIGRKDGQVKLRGQRVELGEIEYHLRNSTKSGWSTAVDVIQPSGHNQEPTLCVFYTVRRVDTAMASGTDTKDEKGLLPPLSEEISKLKLALAELMPPYMQPDFYVRLDSLPFTSSGKLDKKALRHLGSNLSSADWSTYRAPSAHEQNNTSQEDETTPPTSVEPATGNEKKLMQVWSEVLGIDVETISAADDFFSKGGNSIRAMRLVEGARKVGLSLSVAGVFKSPTLSAMALLAGISRPASLDPVVTNQGAFPRTVANVAPPLLLKRLRERFPPLANIVVETILPATDVQAYVVAVGEIDGQGFHNEMTIECKEGLDTQRLAKACSQLVSRHSLFRTIFLQYEATLYQLTVESAPVQQVLLGSKDTGEPATMSGEGPVAFWKHLPRFHLLSLSQDGSRCHKIRLDIHHALYDAFTIKVLMQDLSVAYHGHRPFPEGPRYSDWLSQARSLDPSPSLDFWRDHLRGSSMTRLAAQPSGAPGDHPLVDKKVFQVPAASVPAASLSSAVHAAWAMTLSRLTGSRDVVFATTTANRNLPFPGIDRVAGCCLNFLPVRVRLGALPDASLGQVTEQVHNDTGAAVPHHHVGYRSVMRHCTDWPARTRFGSILTYQIHESVHDDVLIGDTPCTFGGVGRAGDSADAWIIIAPCSSPAGTALDVELMYSKQVISDRKAEWIGRCYTSIFESMESGVIEQLPYPGDDKDMLEDDSGGLASTPKGSTIPAGSDVLPLIIKAWREVDLEVADPDSSLFNQADLVTALLLSYSYDKLGHCVTLKEILQHSTITAQTHLLASRAQIMD